MKPFSELLTDYMRRTGISDSELARTLGVRRQTVFRWKEGLTERPRRREDVLVCAQKLRLLPQERDELLLAAGFAPEIPVAHPPAPELIAEPLSIPAPPRKSTQWFLVVIILLFGLVVFVTVFIRNQLPSYPIAAEGEKLVLISLLDSSAQSATPTPNPRVPPQPSDASSRLQAALEREILAARLERVRVAISPQAAQDAYGAADVRERTRAAIVVWGRIENGLLTASLETMLHENAPASSLDALIIAPNEMQLKLSADEIQALALVILARLQLSRGDYDLARASLTQALSHPPSDAESLAALYTNLGFDAQTSQPPDLDLAIQSYTEALDQAPNAFAPRLNRGVAYVRLNDSIRWQIDLNRAAALRAEDLGANRSLCWAYGLDKDGARALPFCDAAVQRDATPQSREARAIAYAELGRFNDASGDLQMFVNWLGAQPASVRARYGSSRGDWLESLKQNKNPFDDAILSKLRRE